MRHSLPLLLLALHGGCRSSTEATDTEWTPSVAADLGATVARVGQVPIFASQVLAEANRSGKGPRAALEELVSVHLLAERARSSGWRPARSSDVEVKNALVQRLLERELEPNLRPEAVPDNVLRPLYEKVKIAYVHPRLVEVGVLAIYTGALMKPEPRQTRALVAKELAAYLQQHPPSTLNEFSKIALDPAWSTRNVVYLRITQSEDRPLSKRIGEDIVKLRAEGEMTRLLSDDDGFFLARYIGERPPENRSFEEVRPNLLEKFIDTWRRQQFLEFTSRLLQAHKTEIYFDRLNEQGP